MSFVVAYVKSCVFLGMLLTGYFNSVQLTEVNCECE